ncbi:MAG: PEP-CTERM sorting domain-containing protein [Planctomycetota bacterium]|nr:MAG: PEP-CTERM sorting domain-containing protein [Planctomycetota bacterium]
MKSNQSISFGWQALILILALVLFAWFQPAYCQSDGTALLLQQTPEGGGTVTPAVGVHHFELGAQITLTAVPQPGYQFICWLGDVGDSMAGTTTIYLDAPKIVIAVFEQAQFEFAVFTERSQSAPGGGLFYSAGDYSNQGFGGPGGKRPSKRRGQQFVEEPTPPEEDDFPVPEEGDDFPVPGEGDDFPVPEVPEPATICLFGLGGLMLLRKRGRIRM